MENYKNIIELKHITQTFEDGFTAVSDFNLQVKRGEFVTLLGPSGCGKTTTLRMIAGFDQPASGEILLNGKDISKFPPNLRPINTVFQRYALFPHMNVFENIAFGLKQKKTPTDLIIKKVKKMLDLVDLEGFEKRNISTLSGGQQQRVAIARALVNEPEILLLDEPLGALDLKMRKEMQIELKNMHRELGITFIYVTHDQEEALTMSDKIVVMQEGKIQQIGTPEDIYNEPNNAFVADFIGESNIFNGIMTGKYRARFAGGEFDTLDDIPEGTQITAVVRPEDIEIVPEEKGQIKGVVTDLIFKGIHYEITVESGRYEIVIQNTKATEPGTKVGLYVEPDGIHTFPAEDHTNYFHVIINRNHQLEYNDTVLDVDLTKVISGIKLNEEGNLLDANGEEMDTAKLKILAAIQPDDIIMTDNAAEGNVQGSISNLIYKGDHYSYVINTELGQDFIVDDEYLWNMGDWVGLIFPIDKLHFSVKK